MQSYILDRRQLNASVITRGHDSVGSFREAAESSFSAEVN